MLLHYNTLAAPTTGLPRQGGSAQRRRVTLAVFMPNAAQLDGSRPPTTKEDLARLLAIAGEETVPFETVMLESPAQAPVALIVSREADPPGIVIATTSQPTRIANLNPDFEAGGAIFRVQVRCHTLLVCYPPCHA